MKSIFLNKLAIVAILLTIFCLSNAKAQSNKSKTQIVEQNVRAEMNFLAGDAMQGRGSGTMFERIAAEYIGSQFMQFGLEPAGEKDASGNQTFVQTVDVAGRSMLQNVKIGGDLGSSKFGKDFIAFEVSKPNISGELQRIKFD